MNFMISHAVQKLIIYEQIYDEGVHNPHSPDLGYVTTKTSSGRVWKLEITSVSNAGSRVKNAGIFSPKISKYLSDVHSPSVT